MFKPVSISVGGEEAILEKRKITDIFKFNKQPYICTAMSGGGKTTLAIDLIYTFAKECSNVYYITATKESMIDDSISLIPKAFRREPTYENMQHVWDEITNRFDAFNAKPEKITELIVKIYGEKTAEKINDEIEKQKAIIMKRNSKMYKEAGKPREIIPQLVSDDILAFTYELKRRVILFAYKEFQNLDEKLTEEQTAIVNSFVSKPTKSLLILDDITSEFERLKTDNNKVLVNDSWLSKSKAFQALLTDILTKGRHYNCIVVFFVHTIAVFDSKEMIDRIVMFDSSSVQKLNGLKSLEKKTKDLLLTAGNKLFSNGDYKHMFLYYSRSENDICVGKASLHLADQLEMCESLDTFLKLYNNVLSGFKSAGNDEAVEEADDEDGDGGYEEEGAEEEFEGVV